jgi:hypothetical protein
VSTPGETTAAARLLRQHATSETAGSQPKRARSGGTRGAQGPGALGEGRRPGPCNGLLKIDALFHEEQFQARPWLDRAPSPVCYAMASAIRQDAKKRGPGPSPELGARRNERWNIDGTRSHGFAGTAQCESAARQLERRTERGKYRRQ